MSTHFVNGQQTYFIIIFWLSINVNFHVFTEKEGENAEREWVKLFVVSRCLMRLFDNLLSEYLQQFFHDH